MANDEEYNGWSNRETWAIQLHLSNNEGDYQYMVDQAEEVVRYADSKDEAVGRMADVIKDWTEEVYESVLATSGDDRDNLRASDEAYMFVSDVGSWWRADFYEIAVHWIDEAIESVDDDEIEWLAS